MKSVILKHSTADEARLVLESLQSAVSRLAPLWPLESFVAVNPYLGLSDMHFDQAASRLEHVAGAKATLPIDAYLKMLESGDFGKEHLAKALEGFDSYADKLDVDEFLKQAYASSDSLDSAPKVPLMLDAISEVTGKDATQIMLDQVGGWAAAYFDQGQALWKSVNTNTSIYQSWKLEAAHDYTASVHGMGKVHEVIESMLDNPVMAAQEAIQSLDIEGVSLELYLHALLMRLSGWAAYAARVSWEKQLTHEEDHTAVEFLAILLSWEYALVKALDSEDIRATWARYRYELKTHLSNPQMSFSLLQGLVFQKAQEMAHQEQLIEKLNSAVSSEEELPLSRALAQAIFCIDVRSEVYRRNLETVNADIETMGFAGFFGFALNYVPLGHEQGSAQCPVLLKPAHTVKESTGDSLLDAKLVAHKQLRQHVKSCWYNFKMGAISCFSFVGPVGLLYLPKLITDGFGCTRPVRHPGKDGYGKHTGKTSPCSHQHDHENAGVGLSLDQKIAHAEGVLKAMSLRENYARFVLITGHGSTTVNNPHAAGLDCGACGGHTGEVNSRIAADVLNDKAVRLALTSKGIHIPEDTVFLACLHDTTTDEVSILNSKDVPASMAEDFKTIKESLKKASALSRVERAARMGVNIEQSGHDAVFSRSRDWAQVRPEWGLAGCSSFIIAPRKRSKGKSLNGQAFLHSYNWQKDEGFSVLELIMTAPMIVTSWINLQYYGSTVDNALFGSGNKTLHNVVGSIGVLEGNGGDLRSGLPWQSVHDGENYQHIPQKLNVIIEAPQEAILDVIKKHENVRQLCDNGWIHLFAMNEAGKVSHRYKSGLKWQAV